MIILDKHSYTHGKLNTNYAYQEVELPLLVVELQLPELHGELPPVLREEQHLQGQHAVSQQGASSRLPGYLSRVSLPTTTH